MDTNAINQAVEAFRQGLTLAEEIQPGSVQQAAHDLMSLLSLLFFLVMMFGGPLLISGIGTLFEKDKNEPTS